MGLALCYPFCIARLLSANILESVAEIPSPMSEMKSQEDIKLDLVNCGIQVPSNITSLAANGNDLSQELAIIQTNLDQITSHSRAPRMR